MNQPSVDATLNRECSVFCRYLIGGEPNDYVKRKYREAHRSLSWCGRAACSSDELLVSIARIGTRASHIIDAYARVFRPASLIRKKLILLLAILESCAPSHHYLDSVDSNSLAIFALKSILQFASFVLAVGLGGLVIFPLELAIRGTAKLNGLLMPGHG
jgi:hypothetical protein